MRNKGSVLGNGKVIDISKKWGMGTVGDSSLSALVPDLLEEDAPEKEGEFGVCLNDITFEIFGEEITLPFSRVCPWLDRLGIVFLFLSIYMAARIVIRG